MRSYFHRPASTALAILWGSLFFLTVDLVTAESTKELRLPCLKAPVEVIYDEYDIPHIYAQSVEDTYRALGYIHATERLWEMELFRRRASGRLAELIGPDAIPSDKLARKLGIRRTSEESLKTGLTGPDVPRWLDAYSEGVNAKLKEFGTGNLPPVFNAVGLVPEPWQPADSVAFMKYMGWDQSGSDADLWLGMMVEALGPDTVNELWPLDRPYEVTTIPADRASRSVPKELKKAAAAGTISDDIAALASMGPRGLGPEAYSEMISRLASAARDDSGSAYGSNNWVISGAKSSTGKPILCNDPHLGFQIPSLWFTAHLVAPGLNVIGITFPGQPFITIGHTDRMAWGFTNMQSDAVDYFIETVNPDNPRQYKHRGEWKNFEERKETIAVQGGQPLEITIQSTVHGPIDKVGDKILALSWTGLTPTREARAISGLNHAKGLKDYLSAMNYLDTPPMNVIYADVEGNIAIAPWGNLPIRSRGLGRVPVDGASGDFDWVGLIPREDLPISINPPRGYLASANGRPAPTGYPHHLGWMWDPSYRTRRINDLLAGQEKISFEDMQRFQFDAGDKAAEVFTPVLLEVMKGSKSTDPAETAALEALRTWDFVCIPASSAPTIFSRWFGLYRKGVWDDEWKSRGITQPAGSWGYSGDNEREPALEVLEYMTRENPQSVWFDDRTTPERETRDDIIRKSFSAAIAELKSKMGPDAKGWAWGKVNKLKMDLIMPDPASARGGQELTGGPFTLNPGGKGEGVGAGASWRQVVDLGNLGRSVGVYPGGQSGDPSSPHYDDQLPLWVAGKYAPLWFHAKPEGFAAGSVKRRASMKP